jgi:hypothetical protein
MLIYFYEFHLSIIPQMRLWRKNYISKVLKNTFFLSVYYKLRN